MRLAIAAAIDQCPRGFVERNLPMRCAGDVRRRDMQPPGAPVGTKRAPGIYWPLKGNAKLRLNRSLARGGINLKSGEGRYFAPVSASLPADGFGDDSSHRQRAYDDQP